MRFPRADRGRAQSQGELDRLRSFIILASSTPQLVKMTGTLFLLFFLFKKRDFPFTAFFCQMGFAGLNHVRSPSLLPASAVREGAEAPPLWPISASATLAAI